MFSNCLWHLQELKIFVILSLGIICIKGIELHFLQKYPSYLDLSFNIIQKI